MDTRIVELYRLRNLNEALHHALHEAALVNDGVRYVVETRISAMIDVVQARITTLMAQGVKEADDE